MARKQSPRTFTRYVVKVERKTVHGGITERPLEERAEEQKRKWPSGNIKKVGPKVTEETARKWEKELDYQLKKELWCFAGNRIAVTFRYEWHDDSGQWYRSYGNELWEFAVNGLMQRRIASINDTPIATSQREFQ